MVWSPKKNILKTKRVFKKHCKRLSPLGSSNCWGFFSNIEASVVVNWCYINESGFAITAPANAK